MSKAVGIVLSATGISFANEWLTTDDVNYRVLVAGGASALFLNGVERLNATVGQGLAVIMLITVLITPFAGKAPVETLGDMVSGKEIRSK
jgi:hypothetical protein